MPKAVKLIWLRLHYAREGEIHATCEHCRHSYTIDHKNSHCEDLKTEWLKLCLYTFNTTHDMVN